VKFPLIMFAVLLLGGMTNALPLLDISPESVNNSVDTLTSFNVTITLTNTGNETLFNVSFSPVPGTTFEPGFFELINVSGDAQSSFTFESSEPGVFSDSSLVEFYYLVPGTNNSTVPATDPNLYENFSFSINVSLASSSMAVDLLFPNMEIEKQSSKENILTVENLGNEKITNISLSCPYVTFEENDFELGVSGINIVEFEASTSFVNATNETNMTHDFVIIVNSSNAGNSNITLHVFVPFFDFNPLNVTKEMQFIELYYEMCKAEPELALCKGIVNNTIYVNRTQNVTVELPHTVELSDAELAALLENYTVMPSAFARTENKLVALLAAMQEFEKTQDDYAVNMNAQLGVVGSRMNALESYRAEEKEKLRKAESSSFWMMVGVVFIGGFVLFCSVAGFFGYKSYKTYLLRMRSME